MVNPFLAAEIKSAIKVIQDIKERIRKVLKFKKTSIPAHSSFSLPNSRRQENIQK
jgi:hypothetical protein